MTDYRAINPTALRILHNIFDAVLPLQGAHLATTFPPYNVIKKDENLVSMQFALAGYRPEDVEVTVEDRILKIEGKSTDNGAVEYVYKGIAQRNFQKSFKLGQYYEVRDAIHSNGLLTVNLEKIVPAEKQMRRIEINSESVE
jgi:molecular chaperone IbpA